MTNCITWIIGEVCWNLSMVQSCILCHDFTEICKKIEWDCVSSKSED